MHRSNSRRRIERLAALVMMAIQWSACGDDGVGMTEPRGTVLQGSVVRAGTEVLLPDVPVTMESRTVFSNNRGEYRFEDPPLGEVTLTASLDGFLPYERRLEVVQGTNNFDIAMIPENQR